MGKRSPRLDPPDSPEPPLSAAVHLSREDGNISATGFESCTGENESGWILPVVWIQEQGYAPYGAPALDDVVDLRGQGTAAIEQAGPTW